MIIQSDVFKNCGYKNYLTTNGLNQPYGSEIEIFRVIDIWMIITSISGLPYL